MTGPLALLFVTAALARALRPWPAIRGERGLARWRGRSRRGQDALLATTFPDALDVVVLAIGAGMLPAEAMHAVDSHLPAAWRAPFAAVVQRMNRGERFADSITELRKYGNGLATALVDTLAAAERYGLPLAPVLERLAAEARAQRRREADAHARELPVRLAIPLVTCTFTSFVLTAIAPLLIGALSSLRR